MIEESVERFTERMGDRKGNSAPNLAVQVKHPRLWPTPNAGDCKSGRTRESWQRSADRHAESGVNKQLNLQDAAKHWPTPAARSYRSPRYAKPYSERGGGKKGEQLPNAVGGQLNPAWEELLMGFPPGWTEIGKPAPRESQQACLIEFQG